MNSLGDTRGGELGQHVVRNVRKKRRVRTIRLIVKRIGIEIVVVVMKYVNT